MLSSASAPPTSTLSQPDLAALSAHKAGAGGHGAAAGSSPRGISARYTAALGQMRCILTSCLSSVPQHRAGAQHTWPLQRLCPFPPRTTRRKLFLLFLVFPYTVMDSRTLHRPRTRLSRVSKINFFFLSMKKQNMSNFLRGAGIRGTGLKACWWGAQRTGRARPGIWRWFSDAACPRAYRYGHSLACQKHTCVRASEQQTQRALMNTDILT